jgi:hypothetical protein
MRLLILVGPHPARDFAFADLTIEYSGTMSMMPMLAGTAKTTTRIETRNDRPV